MHGLKQVLLLFATLGSFCAAEWRWANDTLEPTDDKQVHAIGSFGLYYMLVYKNIEPNKAVAIISSLGIAKECADALVPWERYGRMGGDGFSTNDILYNILGLATAYITDNAWKVSYDNNMISISWSL